MNLTGFAIGNHRFTALIVITLAVAGMMMFMNFPSRSDPNVTVREAVIVAYYPGMEPGRVENLITRKIERKIRQIPEVKTIKSDSKTGVAIVHAIVYDKFFDMKPIWQDLRNKMAQVRTELPQGTFGPLVDTDFGDVSVATIALTAEGFSFEQMRKVARDITNEIYTVPGTRRVVMSGVQQERIFIETTNARLARYGLSPDTLLQTLQAQNIILPGGKVNVDGYEVVIQPTGNFDSVEDIGNTVVKLPGSEQVTYLRDLMEIRRAYESPPQEVALYNGRPAIMIAVSMQKKGTNVLEFGPLLKQKVAEIEGELPVGYSIDFATYQATYVEQSVSGVLNNVYETIAIVLVMIMLFLGWRTGLIVGSLVPLTMLITLVFMRLLDIEFQRVSLATMIIALGLLVDNGIVIAEDITRRMSEGVKRQAAALATGKQLAMPLLSSSLTTVLAFMPLMLASDSSGEYMRSMSLVILLSLMVSWGVAMCFTPLLCIWFMPEPKKTPEQAKAQFDKPLFRAYRKFIELMVRMKYLVAATMIGTIAASFSLLSAVPQQFFPESDRNQYLVYIDLPSGATTEATQKTMTRFTQWLGDTEKNPKVTQSVAYVGYGGPRFFASLAPRDSASNIGFALVTVETGDDVSDMIAKTRRYFAGNHPEAYARVKKFFLGNTEPGLVEVRLRGREPDRVTALGREVEQAFRDIPGTIGLYQNWGNRVTNVIVEIDQARARRAQVTSREIANSLNAYFGGDAVSVYREADQTIPIVIRAKQAERTDMDRLRSIEVYSQALGTGVLLSDVAEFRAVNQYSKIARYNLKRAVTVEAKHSWMQAQDLLQAVQPALDKIEAKLPPGYVIEIGGEPHAAAKGQNALFEYVPHCLAAMILLLVWQFNSFAKPAIVFLSIPLSFLGAAVGLLATGSFLGFMATLGFLSLAGIIINNAIVLIDETQVQIDAGKHPFEAVVEASVSRLQPVMMTTATTILGLFTLMIPPSPLFFAMAVVIAAGLSVGTLLTLVAVPVLYAIFFRVRKPTGEAEADSSATSVPAAAPAPAG